MTNKLKIPVTDTDILLGVMNSYPLATVITQLEGTLEISHLPLVVEKLAMGGLKIQGHLSKRNPQWRHLKAGASMVLVFYGPNTYINSGWYVVNDVSTWNYITVQAEGAPVVEESYKAIVDILKATTDHTNSLYEDQWDFYIPEDLRSETDFTDAIGGFTLEPKKLFGKFKLSQSKSRQDQERIIQELHLRKDENSKLIAKFMAENFV